MVQNVYDKILDFGGTEAVPCVIVGAKTDLETRSTNCFHTLPYLTPFFSSPNRQIDQSEGERLAQQNHAAWVETSSKDNVNIGKL